MRAIALLAILMLLTVADARAWGKYGHVLVCEMAYRQLSDTARAKLNALIDQQDFRDEHGEKLYPSFN